MLWAIYRIYRSIKETAGISELFDQKMIVIHIATFTLYIISIVIAYVFYYLWDQKGSDSTNYFQSYYLSWTIAVVLLACA